MSMQSSCFPQLRLACRADSNPAVCVIFSPLFYRYINTLFKSDHRQQIKPRSIKRARLQDVTRQFSFISNN